MLLSEKREKHFQGFLVSFFVPLDELTTEIDGPFRVTALSARILTSYKDFQKSTLLVPRDKGRGSE